MSKLFFIAQFTLWNSIRLINQTKLLTCTILKIITYAWLSLLIWSAFGINSSLQGVQRRNNACSRFARAAFSRYRYSHICTICTQNKAIWKPLLTYIWCRASSMMYNVERDVSCRARCLMSSAMSNVEHDVLMSSMMSNVERVVSCRARCLMSSMMSDVEHDV